MNTGRTYAVGETVRLRWGHDVVEGAIVDTYNDGSGLRVVVRLQIPYAEPFTVALPASELQRLQSDTDIDEPGTWLSAYDYERRVMIALEKAAFDVSRAAGMRDGQRIEVENLNRDFHRWDAMLHADDHTVAVEIIFRKNQVGIPVVDHFASELERSVFQGYALMIANVPFAKAAVKMASNRGLTCITWRSAADDGKLREAISKLFAVNIARWRADANDPAGAVEMLRDALKERLGSFEPSDPQVLEIRHELARTLGKAGNVSAALKELQDIAPAYRHAFGEDHPQTLKLRLELAHLLDRAGNAPAALEELQRLIPAYYRVLGPDNAQTLEIRRTLAHTLNRAGNVSAAIDELRGLVLAYSHTFGADHPQTLELRLELIHLLGEAGDISGALALAQDLVPTAERVWGPQSRKTKNVKRELAKWRQESSAH
jgi:thioredoxin-like negative regulator of GroEL